jgi:hypothetical protein
VSDQAALEGRDGQLNGHARRAWRVGGRRRSSRLPLAGTVLGLLLLGIDLYRTRTGPTWVGPAIWAFLVIEFVGTAISRYASYPSVLLPGAAFVALAAWLHTTDPRRDDPRTVPSNLR